MLLPKCQENLLTRLFIKSYTEDITDRTLFLFNRAFKGESLLRRLCTYCILANYMQSGRYITKTFLALTLLGKAKSTVWPWYGWWLALLRLWLGAQLQFRLNDSTDGLTIVLSSRLFQGMTTWLQKKCFLVIFKNSFCECPQRQWVGHEHNVFESLLYFPLKSINFAIIGEKVLLWISQHLANHSQMAGIK